MNADEPEIEREQENIIRLSYCGTVLERVHYAGQDGTPEWGDEEWRLTIGDRVFEVDSWGHDASGIYVSEAAKDESSEP